MSDQGKRSDRSAESPIKNGDVVEILTQAGHLPSKDWLAIVKTSRARNKIKHVINANERERAIDIGQKYLEKEARRLGVAMSRIARADLETCRLRVRLQQDRRPARRAGIRSLLGAAGPSQACAGSGRREGSAAAATESRQAGMSIRLDGKAGKKAISSCASKAWTI